MCVVMGTRLFGRSAYLSRLVNHIPLKTRYFGLWGIGLKNSTISCANNNNYYCKRNQNRTCDDDDEINDDDQQLGPHGAARNDRDCTTG